MPVVPWPRLGAGRDEQQLCARHFKAACMMLVSGGLRSSSAELMASTAP
jgi:hypothetical protein